MVDRVTELKTLYLAIGKRTYSILRLDLSYGVNMLPHCVVSISAGVNVTTGQTSPKPINIDDECEIYYQTAKAEKPTLLFSGFISSEVHETGVYLNKVKGYKQYRVALKMEMIDAIAPTSVRYLTGATGQENAVIKGFIMTSNGADDGKNKASVAAFGEQAKKDLGGTLLKTIDYLYDSIKEGNKNATAKGTDAPENIRKYITADKIQVNAGTDVRMYPQIADMLAGSLLSGGAYTQVLLDTVTSLYLSFMMKYSESKKCHVLNITHLNNWAEPKGTIDLSMYSDMTGADMSRRAQTIDGVIIPLYEQEDDKTTSTALYSFYGKLKNKKTAEVQHIEPNKIEQYLKDNKLRLKQMMFPSWLAGANASSMRDNCARLCREFFAQYSCATRTLSITIPFYWYQTISDNLGKPLAIIVPAGRALNLDQIATNKLIGVVSTISLSIWVDSESLEAGVTVTFTHVRTEEEQKEFGFKDTDKHLLYKVIAPSK